MARGGRAEGRAGGRAGATPEPAGFRLARYAALAVLIAIIGVPLVAVILRGARPELLAGLAEPEIREATLNTLVTSGLGTLAATVMGVTLAWLVERTDIPWRNFFRAAFFVPFLIPPFIGTIGWLAVLGPVGYVNAAYNNATGSQGGLVDLYGPGGIIVLFALHSYPIVYLIVAAALGSVPGALEEAARAGGAGRLRVAVDVTLPLVFPAILAGFILTLVSNLSDFGIPALLGVPEQYQVLPTLIYSYLISGQAEDPLGAASAVGLVLLALAGAAFVLQRRLSRRVDADVAGTPAAPVALGRGRYPVAVLLGLTAAVFSLAPIAALLIGSLLPAPGVPLTLDNLTLENLEAAVTAPAAARGFVNSLLLAGGAAALCAIIGAFVATVVSRTTSRINATLDNLSLAPQALPGTVVAVGWILIGIPAGIYNTRLIILLAYVMAFVALVVQTVRGPLASVPASMEEAARLSGASPLRTLADVTWPLSRTAVLVGAGLVFFTAIREIAISALLIAPGTETLGVVIFNLQRAGNFSSATTLALLVAIGSLLGLGALAILSRGRLLYGPH